MSNTGFCFLGAMFKFNITSVTLYILRNQIWIKYRLFDDRGKHFGTVGAIRRHLHMFEDE